MHVSRFEAKDIKQRTITFPLPILSVQTLLDLNITNW